MLGRPVPGAKTLPERPPERPLAYVYDAAYQTAPNWDIGRPQRAFVYLVEAGLVQNPVLDLGCGTGELSLFLAREGYDVLGIDISSVAVEQARERARWRRNPARFLVWDALYLERLARAGFSFGTVVDCAMYHILHESERDRVVEGLETVLPRGGLYAVLGDAKRDGQPGYGITPAEVEGRFQRTGHWEPAFAYRTIFERRWSSNPAYFVGMRRT